MNTNFKHIVAEAIASLFYIGKSKMCPGTIGSFFAVIPFIFLGSNRLIVGAITLSIFVIGIWASEIYEQIYKVQDPGTVVIDEVVGICMVFYICGNFSLQIMELFHHFFKNHYITNHLDKYGFFGYNVIYCTLVFSLFRFFDILKPFPVSFFDSNVHGGLGIMLDDVVAGIMAGVTLQVIYVILKLI